MGRILFRFAFGVLLVTVFAVSAWISLQKSILGRSILVPNLIGKNIDEAERAAREAGMRFSIEKGRERYDVKIAARSVLLQEPAVGSFVKPGQTIRAVLSLGPNSIRVPELSGLSPRAAGLSLARASLSLGDVSNDREQEREAGIFSQYPEPDATASEAAAVAVLYNRSRPARVFIMPDLIGRIAATEKEHLARYGFRFGATRYEVYEGTAPDTILRQYPPAGYPVSGEDPITLTAAGASAP